MLWVCQEAVETAKSAGERRASSILGCCSKSTVDERGEEPSSKADMSILPALSSARQPICQLAQPHIHRMLRHNIALCGARSCPPVMSVHRSDSSIEHLKSVVPPAWVELSTPTSGLQAQEKKGKKGLEPVPPPVLVSRQRDDRKSGCCRTDASLTIDTAALRRLQLLLFLCANVFECECV